MLLSISAVPGVPAPICERLTRSVSWEAAMGTPSIDITPEVTIWARERLRASIPQIAEAVGVEADTLAAWEAGESEPTFRQAKQLAHVLKIPFGYLFLSSVPTARTPLPDLRTVKGQRPPEASQDMLDQLNDILRKQHWYSEFVQAAGEEALPFVGKFTIDACPLPIHLLVIHRSFPIVTAEPSPAIF